MIFMVICLNLVRNEIPNFHPKRSLPDDITFCQINLLAIKACYVKATNGQGGNGFRTKQ